MSVCVWLCAMDEENWLICRQSTLMRQPNKFAAAPRHIASHLILQKYELSGRTPNDEEQNQRRIQRNGIFVVSNAVPDKMTLVSHESTAVDRNCVQNDKMKVFGRRKCLAHIAPKFNGVVFHFLLTFRLMFGRRSFVG